MKFDKLTKKELLDLAAQKEIKGRTKMSKEELILELEKHYMPSHVSSTSSQHGYSFKDASHKHELKKDEYPIPSRYNHDTLVLMPVDPKREYVYWEVSDHTLNTSKSRLRLSDTKLILKVFMNKDNSTTETGSIAVDRMGNWYFDIYAPDSILWSELGFIDTNGAFHAILKSRVVKMPSDKVSDIIDKETWMSVGNKIDTLYKLSGVGLRQGSSININEEHFKQISEHINSSNHQSKK